ncbi:MAG: right-handed parallel beta-helix repeat-containing protein [Planctomycetes bacterium]|nr:right-handed parallel beta-helix repeat-containing protein [Planctomycetota bacterium]MBL7042485.1 right-handed parallel beta-helix repeat-containing protein [Pirellulaceae bacterium]
MRRLQFPLVVFVVLLGPLAVVYVIGTEGPSSDVPAPKELATIRDFGAVGDGRADDTAAIQKAVNASVGDVRFPHGTYRVTKPIVVELQKVGWTSLIGNGTARIVMAGPGPAFKYVGTHAGTADPSAVKPDVWERQRMPIVDGIEIIGAHDEAVGIEATGTMQLLVTRVAVREALHGIHLTTRNRNVIISDCHLYKNAGVGLYLDRVNLHQINVTGCHISYNGGGGVVVRGGGVCNLQISGCDIEANMDPDGEPTANVLVDGGGVTAELAIVGCTIQHTHTAPDSANIRFIGADSRDRIWGNVTISGNVISDTQIGVDIQTARGVSIVGNTFWKGYQYDLRIEDSRNVVVGPNVFDRNPNYWDPQGGNNALLFRNCQDATLNGLHLSGVTGAEAGLVLEGCRRVNVTGCTIVDCAGGGILLKNVTDSRVSDCLIRNDLPDKNSWLPVKVLGGRDNMVADDLLSGHPEADPPTVHASGNVTK